MERSVGGERGRLVVSSKASHVGGHHTAISLDSKRTQTKSTHLSLPRIRIGSYSLCFSSSGCTKSSGLPFTLIKPLPGLHTATAVAFFFLPKVCTTFFSCLFFASLRMVDRCGAAVNGADEERTVAGSRGRSSVVGDKPGGREERERTRLVGQFGKRSDAETSELAEAKHTERPNREQFGHNSLTRPF